MDSENYANIRKILGELIGKRVVDITQHDKDEFEENGHSYVMLMFEDGLWAKFLVEDSGFYHNCEKVEVGNG
jgi:hypothetical protein